MRLVLSYGHIAVFLIALLSWTVVLIVHRLYSMIILSCAHFLSLSTLQVSQMTGVGPLPKLTFLEVESYVVVVGWWLNCNLNCENQKSHGHELSKKKKPPFYHHHHLDSYVSTWSGANCGSLFLDLRFRELVKVGTIDVSVIYLCSLC